MQMMRSKITRAVRRNVYDRPDYIWQMAKKDTQSETLFLDVFAPQIYHPTCSYLTIKNADIDMDLNICDDPLIEILRDAEEIYTDTAEDSLRWPLEAYLSTTLSKGIIAQKLSIPVSLVIVYFHVFYWVDLFGNEKASFEQYVLRNSSPKKYDRDAKSIAYNYGHEIYESFYYSPCSVQEKWTDDRKIAALCRYNQAVDKDLAGLEGTTARVNAALMQLRERSVSISESKAEALGIGEDGVGGNTADALTNAMVTLRDNMKHLNDQICQENAGENAKKLQEAYNQPATEKVFIGLALSKARKEQGKEN